MSNGQKSSKSGPGPSRPAATPSRTVNRLIRGLLVWVAWILLSTFWPGDARAAAVDTEAAFKQLLSSPPAVEQLIYREKLPPFVNRPVPLDLGISTSTNYALFELRWQTNAMLVRSLTSTNDVGTARVGTVAFTLLGEQFCFLDSGTNAFFYRLEHRRAQEGDVPPAYDAAYYRVTRYGEILNLGLSHVWPGSVHWDGDRFYAKGIADKKPMHVFGAIARRTNDLPCELSVTYSNNTSVARYRIAYQYQGQTNSARLFPTQISLFYIGAEKEIEYRTYDILSFKPASRVLPDSYFSPEPFMQYQAMSARYFTNNSIYARLPSGQWIESHAPAPRLTFTGEDYYRNRYFYLALAGVTAVFVHLAVKSETKKTKETKC